MKNNIFDKVMDYIDEHIRDNYSDIKKGVYNISSYSDMDFSKFLSILSGGEFSLRSYFVKRKLSFIAKELVENRHKTILDITKEYGYSEQPALNRAIKNQYDYTPNEIREQKLTFEDNRLNLSDFCQESIHFGKRLQDNINSLIGLNPFVEEDDYFSAFIKATDEYSFDTATCLAISEISERTKVPFEKLLNAVFNSIIDIISADDYIDPVTEKIIDCCISSKEELDNLCEYYNCEYYQLNSIMVATYRRKNGEN